MFRNKYVNAFWFGCAIAILVVLYYKTASHEREAYFETAAMIRDLQRLDADWNTQILRTGILLNQDFDPLAGELPRLRALKEKLSESELNLTTDEFKQTRQQLAMLFQLLDSKEKLVENFKSGHAVMRNSVRFLPTAEREVIEAARFKAPESEVNETVNLQVSVSGAIEATRIDEIESEAIEAARKQNLADFIERIRGFTGRVYEYVLLSGSLLKSQLSGRLNEIKAPPASVNLEGPLDTFKIHAELIVNRNADVKSMMHDAVSVPTAAAAEELLRIYEALQAARTQSAEQYRLLLIAYASLLVLVLVFFTVRLRQSYGALNFANRSLQKVNETLEQKVEERARMLRDSQTQLIQSEKLAAIGQMVAGVAHEINTPLGYITSNVEIVGNVLLTMEELVGDLENQFNPARSQLPQDREAAGQRLQNLRQKVKTLVDNETLPESKGLFEDIKYGLNQINDIVLNLKEFSRVDRSMEDDFDINEGLERTLKIAYNSYKNVAEVVTKYGQVPRIRCFPSQINQVFLNLIANAVFAVTQVKRPGVVTIGTGTDGNYVYVSIKDNGIGMDEEVQKRIFEPFFTTKDVGQGTGLGLSISHSIIAEHQGKILVHSKPDAGSQFMVFLPLKNPKSVEVGVSAALSAKTA